MAHALAGIGGTGTGGRRPALWTLRLWLGVGCAGRARRVRLAAVERRQQVREFEELDAQILTSDLPIDAYLDRGFQHWLKTSSEP